MLLSGGPHFAVFRQETLMTHPLKSWDIILEGLERRQEFASDIQALERIGSERKWRLPFASTLDNTLVWENKVILVTDPKLTIEFATRNIEAMNGYHPQEVIGKTPRMFQGVGTTEQERSVIRHAIKQIKPFDSVITNYKKDGNIYKCRVEGFPIFDHAGTLVNFIALETTQF